ncbi:D-alanyl-D-alanine carboxypeptidase, partial [Neisseria sp. P0001.S010]
MKEYVGKSFVNQWRQQDGTVSDGLTTGAAPHDAHVLASHLSKPLTDILTDMNKHSNNLIARSVFLKFAGNMSDYKLAQTKAASIVKSELAVAGINTEGLVLENGSGLSRV